MRNNKTKVLLLKQQDGQHIDDYQKQLQIHLDSINERENVYGGAMCFPTSDGRGILTTMIQWQESEKEKEIDWSKENS